jgi:selenium metabolism protein YedF
MGMGDQELGILLAKAFVNTIKDVEPLPETIVFYNTGIFLALKNSPVVEPLRHLESLGVRILVCGTCLDFYEKKEAVGAGTISNMYDILQALSSAGHVITP